MSSFSPIVPHNEDQGMTEDDVRLSSDLSSIVGHAHSQTLDGPARGTAANEFVQRALTPVIGSFSQGEEALHHSSNLKLNHFRNLMASSLTQGSQTPMPRPQSMCASQSQQNRLKHSPLVSQLSRQFSGIDAESVASSAISSISTRNQIDKCKDVISKALHLKKLVSSAPVRTHFSK